ncbi:uncharacterized protein PV09_05220 [Verruconis gallopava]|uniref:RING-type domain-containing protein n=1 Tax=Verruconis gallopava TaxID=253628 RepID=A0A0D2AA52_9PEZI|nr:uncharacterized protein PV09_05220 [Verruconis gallopava]KIW03450.1 hypothetical protein PV09_05220 [Verruconis gallopava]
MPPSPTLPPHALSFVPPRPRLVSIIRSIDPLEDTSIAEDPPRPPSHQGSLQATSSSNTSPSSTSAAPVESHPSSQSLVSNMPPRNSSRLSENKRPHKRSASQAVDLDDEEADAEAPSTSAAGTSRKRRNIDTAQRRRGSGQGGPRSQGEPIVIEDLDDVDEDSEKDEEAEKMKETLQRQREEQVKAAQESDKEPPRLNKLQCVICMDSFTDMTATSCGHIFCHECLISALKASEARRFMATGIHGKKSQCPVCRTTLNRSKKGDVIPLLIMKQGLKTQPRKMKDG